MQHVCEDDESLPINFPVIDNVLAGESGGGGDNYLHPCTRTLPLFDSFYTQSHTRNKSVLEAFSSLLLPAS